jgi:type VI secretion system protein
MALIVEVTSFKGVPLLSPKIARFDESGGSIGRSFDNHLALPDEDKIISRHHGEIRSDNGAFIYTDTSTGGTLLCNENRLLENGVSVTLAEGDLLKVGEFELRVRIENGEQSFPGLFSGLGDSQPFGSHDAEPMFNLSVPPLFTDSVPNPVFAQAVAPPVPVVNDSFINQPDAPSFQENFTPPGIQSLPEEFSFEDILRSEPVLPRAIPPKKDNFEFPDDWFGDLGLDTVVGGEPSSTATEPSHLDTLLPVAQESSFTEPPLRIAAVDENPNFYAELDSPPLAPALRLGTPVAPISGDMDRMGHKLTASCNPSAVPDMSEVKGGNVGMQLFSGTSAQVIDLPHPGRSIPPSRAAAAAAASDPAPAPPQPPPAPAAAKAIDLFQCFLQGAGLAEFPQMTEEEQEEAMKALGEVYREMVDGMMMILRARSEEKREIRTDVTLIRKEKNNPLKFIPTVEDAVKVMISRKYSGYIDATLAVREGFTDIMKHQMAMRAGLQVAVGEILRRFEPAVFEQPFGEGFVFQKKAKCWDAYAKAYPRTVTEAMDNLFGDKFAMAYENQMRMLRDSHDKG